MQPTITIRDLPNSPSLEDHIRKKADKLNQFYQRINSCRIVITMPQKHKHNGKLFCVRIDLTVPGKEIVVNRKKDEDIYVAVRDAFHAVERQLETYARKQRGDVKTHENSTKGVIARMFHEEGYGFIRGNDGNEYYFSDASIVVPNNFLQLKVDDAVEFIGLPGNDGLQASRVIREKHNHLIEEK